MTYEDLIKHFGSCANAARALTLRRQVVHRWKTNGIPEPRQFQVEVVTRGKLKAPRKAVQQ